MYPTHRFFSLMVFLVAGGSLLAKMDPSKVMKQSKDLPPSEVSKCLPLNSKAPDFTLPLVGGGNWVLKDMLKKGPVVLIFYRGGWCPFCNIQLRSYEAAFSSFQVFKTNMLAISPDQLDLRYVDKPTPKLKFPVASDSDLKVITLYNVLKKVDEDLVLKYKKDYKIDLEGASGKKHHTIAVPAIVVIDQKQHIQWCYAHQNYKIRPASAAIVSVLKKL